jgi:3',5'-cyclic-AMP phosphodiesterase
VAGAIARSGVDADALLVTGDLADHGAAAEYETVHGLLAPLGLPLYVLPGNHDDRAALRGCFDVPGEGAAPVQYAVDIGGLRLVVLDTQRPGHDDGELDGGRLAFAEEALAGDTPTLLAMHHPPATTGVAGWDDVGLAAAGRERLAAAVAGSAVSGIVAGHLHCTVTARLAGRPVLTIPSTYVQARPVGGEIEFYAGPSAFAVHRLAGGELASYLVPVPLA